MSRVPEGRQDRRSGISRQPIDGHTHLVGLVGWPVEHSMSPAMHNAAFAALGLNWRYVPLPVPHGHVEEAVRGLAALGFRGANVTVPHKRAVMSALDTVADEAEALGAVNTIVIERDEQGQTTLHGHNTDAAGFIGALRGGGFELQGSSVVVVGAGGAARAVAYGLAEAEAREIVVLNRTLKRAQALVADLRRSSRISVDTGPLDDEALVQAARAADLLVNATPVGMWPRTDTSIWPQGVPLPADLTVFDLIYNPLETKLLRQARRSGAQTMDGLGMLVRQGALAFELWTGEKAPLGAMRAASEQRLRE